MLQRIQSVYLFIVTVLLMTCMFLSTGYFSTDAGVHQMVFKALGVTVPDQPFQSTWGLFVLLLLSSIISFITIFLYKNRPLQIRLSIFNAIILVGYYCVLGFFIWKLKAALNAEFFMNWAICLPAVALILDILAIRAIGKDEVMVRASDRIR